MENEITPQKRCEIGERGKEGPCDNSTEIFTIAHMAIGRMLRSEVGERFFHIFWRLVAAVDAFQIRQDSVLHGAPEELARRDDAINDWLAQAL